MLKINVAKNNSHPRRQGREAVLQALYAYEIAEEDRNKVLQDALGRKSFDENMRNFITNLFDVTIDNKEWCEEQIKSRLNNWEFDRVALLDRLLLCVAISEICFVDDVPPKVSISEAIEIAKQYSTEESSSFVNGVLDNVYKTIAKETEKKSS
ncbi:MAG TPA: transcription antitermination factor NusB [Candidatus Marinimicrobia bacterium]|nr:transcription antitermination factor NusB [Candidatus Neomarinimicrobiota bacterium]HIB26768.1 transcription antitermination factor NusB [Candidatus Neomarinimicrobiota bacterium]HIB33395.1 transcription antitermination factor NusB [Candidatus Neomarinimicrobiota bacterium]